MANIENYGVGTGFTSKGVTGKKTIFSHDEKIYAVHVWDNVNVNDVFKIRFTKFDGNIWKTIVDYEWINSEGFIAIYHQAWIRNYGAGDYKVFFYRNNIIAKNTPFKVKEKPAEPVEPKPNIYPKTISRGAYSFSARNSEEEKQLKEFLGIDPPGDDLDTWLSKKDKSEIGQWFGYWGNIFFPWRRDELIEFLKTKSVEYIRKLDEEIPPEKTWLERFINTAGSTLSKWFKTKPALIDAIYLKVTGKPFTEEEFVKLRLSEAEALVPINVLSKLFTGKNLEGKSEEFGSAEDYIDMMLLAVSIIPTGRIAGTGAKLALSKISVKEAAILTAKLGDTATINRLIKIVKAHPETSARFLAKFPQPVREAVISGLYKTPAGRIAAVTLGKTGYYKFLSSGWKKIIRGFTVFGLISAGIFLPIFAITEIPNYFLMRTFARKAIAQAEGKYPPDFAFQLNEFENSLETITFELERNIKDNNFESARENLDALESIVNNYENYINEKKEIMFTEDFDLSVELIEFYKRLIEDRRKLIGEGPIIQELVKIRAFPNDADIVISGVDFVKNPFERLLPLRTYDVNITRFQHDPQSFSFTLTEGNPFEREITLEEEIEPPTPPEEQKGNIIISLDPQDSIIEVAGQPEITSAGTYELFQGFYDLKASKEGFETSQQRVFVRSQEDTRASFVLNKIVTPPEISIIRVNSIPLGAKIFIDGENTFEITNTAFQIEPGAHKLTLKERDFIDDEIEFEIKAGETIEFNRILEAIPVSPEPTKATITITSEPTNADIYIDGEYTFTKTPYTILLDAGSYLIRIQKEGYTPVEIIAEVSEGEVAEIPLNLTALPITDIPPAPYIPYQPVYPSGFENLYPTSQAPKFYEKPAPQEKRELLINIETTDVKPWEGRIYSIALQDLNVPEVEPIVLVGDNEEELIRGFLDIFDFINPEKLIGFKLIFDYRYIFAKMMLFRIPNKKYKDVDLRDVKQIMDQVKEEFVYFPSKIGTLDDWGKMLLGIGKYGSQELMLRKYLEGDFEYVTQFQLRQLEITKGLYDLSRFVSSEAISAPSTSNPESLSEPNNPGIPANPGATSQRSCPNCKAFQPIGSKNCEICGTLF